MTKLTETAPERVHIAWRDPEHGLWGIRYWAVDSARAARFRDQNDVPTVEYVRADLARTPASVVLVLNRLWDALHGEKCIPSSREVDQARRDLELVPSPPKEPK